MDLAFLNRVIPRNPSASPLGLRGSYADPIRNIDWILMSAVIAQVIIGVFTVFSATRQRLLDQNMDVFVYVQRQVFFVIIAVINTAIGIIQEFRARSTIMKLSLITEHNERLEFLGDAVVGENFRLCAASGVTDPVDGAQCLCDLDLAHEEFVSR